MPTDDPRLEPDPADPPADRRPADSAGRSTPAAPVFQPLAAEDPREVGGYRLFARLGSGGMGRVYLSYTPGGRPVALKVVRPEFAEDSEFRRRFRQEVSNAQRIHGLYTAEVIDAGPDAESPWLVTAYVPGPSLQQVVREHGSLPVRTVLLLMGGIAEALQAIHSVEVVHRDLKPANVLVAADGPRVIDFGIARAADATALTGTGYRIGSPAFMAPEQALGRSASPATDVFALGALAAYVAGGSSPFGEGPDTAVLYRVVHEEPELADCPAELRELVLRCLAKAPEDRPQPAEIIRLCREHPAVGGALRFSDDWLPSPVNTEITRRSDLPKTPPPSAPTAADATERPPVPSAPPMPSHVPTPQVQPVQGVFGPPPTHPQPAQPQPAHPQPTQPQPTVPLRQDTPPPAPAFSYDTPPPTPVTTAAPGPAARPEPPERRRGVSAKVLLTVAAVTALAGIVGGVALSRHFDRSDDRTPTAGERHGTSPTPGASTRQSAPPADPTADPTTDPATDAPADPVTDATPSDDGQDGGSPDDDRTGDSPAAAVPTYTAVYKGRTLSVPDYNHYFDLKTGKVVPESGEWTLGTNSQPGFELPDNTDAYITKQPTLTPEQCSSAIDREPVGAVDFEDTPAGRLFCLRSRSTGDVSVVKVLQTSSDDYSARITVDYYRNDS
ncbi:protein kinase [Streptomyces sp. NPDC092296]|uniref:serine/threonine-protein kinase n=1 Tax=Streptomyces sp. NPDC092296 TaxID=3366012 RepID=UPI0037FB5A6B